MEGAKKQIKPTPVRMPEELRQWLRHQSVDSRRSLNSEIVHRLEESRKREIDRAAA